MSEIRLQEIILVGRMVGDPMVRSDGVYFRFAADQEQGPFPCYCNGKTADNLLKHLRDGDEFSIEGKLIWKRFQNTSPTLIIHARFTSYGRKSRTLRPGSGMV